MEYVYSAEYYSQTLPDAVFLLTFHSRSPNPDITPPTSVLTAKRGIHDRSPSEADHPRLNHIQIQRRILNFAIGSPRGR